MDILVLPGIVDPIFIFEEPLPVFIVPVEKVPPTTGHTTTDPGSGDPTTGTSTGPDKVTPGGGRASDGRPGPATLPALSRATPPDTRTKPAAIGLADAFVTAPAAPTVAENLSTTPSPATPPATAGNVALVPPLAPPTAPSPPARFEEPDSQSATPLDQVIDDSSAPADRRAVQASTAEDDSAASVSLAAETGACDPSGLDSLYPHQRPEADKS